MLSEFTTPAWKKWTYLVVACLFVLSATITKGSDAYRECYEKEEAYQVSFSGPEGRDFLDVGWWWWRCQWVAINENEGIVIGLFTAGLVLATAFLWIETRRLAKGAQQQASDTKDLITATNQIGLAGQKTAVAAETSADAAKHSADAAIAAINRDKAADRARFHVAINDQSFGAVLDAIILGNNRGDTFVGTLMSVSVEFVNYGRTYATIQEIWLAGPVFAADPPATSSLQLHNRQGSYEIMLNGGARTESITLVEREHINFPDALCLLSNTKSIWVRGRVYYRDAFNDKQRHCFLLRFRFINGEGVLSPYDHEDYNEST